MGGARTKEQSKAPGMDDRSSSVEVIGPQLGDSTFLDQHWS